MTKKQASKPRIFMLHCQEIEFIAGRADFAESVVSGLPGSNRPIYRGKLDGYEVAAQPLYRQLDPRNRGRALMPVRIVCVLADGRSAAIRGEMEATTRLYSDEIPALAIQAATWAQSERERAAQAEADQES